MHAFSHLVRKIGTHPALARDLGFLLVYALLVYAAHRSRVPARSFSAAGSSLRYPSGSLESEARFGLLALPVYFGIASLTRSRRVELVARVGSLALLVTWVILLPYLWL